MPTMKPATLAQADALRIAYAMLREARKHLAKADCPKTLERVRLAISSAEGATRHMDRRRQRAKETAGYYAAPEDKNRAQFRAVAALRCGEPGEVPSC